MEESLFLFVGWTSVDSPPVTITFPAPTGTYSPTLTQQTSSTVEPSDTVALEETLTLYLPFILSHPHTEVVYIIPITVQHKTPVPFFVTMSSVKRLKVTLFYWLSEASVEAGNQVPVVK